MYSFIHLFIYRYSILCFWVNQSAKKMIKYNRLKKQTIYTLPFRDCFTMLTLGALCGNRQVENKNNYWTNGIFGTKNQLKIREQRINNRCWCLVLTVKAAAVVHNRIWIEHNVMSGGPHGELEHCPIKKRKKQIVLIQTLHKLNNSSSFHYINYGTVHPETTS